MAIPTMTNNSPSAGNIAWGAFNIQLHGVTYSVGAGSSNQRWVWWKYNNGAPSIIGGQDVPDTLIDDDLVLFANKNGVGVRVQSTNFVDGELLVDGSIFADALSVNLINSQHIVTAGLDAGVIKFGSMSGDRISVNTLSGDRILANTIGTSKLVVTDFTNYAIDFNDAVERNTYIPPSGFSWNYGGTAGDGWRVSALGVPQWGVFTIGPKAQLTGPAEFEYTIDVYRTAGSQSWRLGVNGWNEIGTLSPDAGYMQITTAVPVGVWTTVTAKVTIAAGITVIQPHLKNTTADGSQMYFRKPRMYRRMNGALLVDGTITAAQIAAGTITAAQIAAGTITALQIAAGTITATQIATDTITALQIAANAITVSELAANSVTAAKIVANTITAGQIAANTITAGQIAANTITAGQIAANTITATQIAATTITAAQIAAGTITATQIATGTITATQIAAGTIDTTQLKATAINGFLITGATLQTSTAANTGIKITPTDLKVWDPSNNETVVLSTSGQHSFIGELGTAKPGAVGTFMYSTTFGRYGTQQTRPVIQMNVAATRDQPSIQAIGGTPGLMLFSGGNTADRETRLIIDNGRILMGIESVANDEIYGGAGFTLKRDEIDIFAENVGSSTQKGRVQILDSLAMFGYDITAGGLQGYQILSATACRVSHNQGMEVTNTAGAAWRKVVASAFQVGSDRGLKKNIAEPRLTAMSVLRSAPTYEWEYDLDTDTGRRVGPMAEDLPAELISEIQTEDGDHFAEGMKTVDLHQMVSMLWQAVQEMDAELDKVPGLRKTTPIRKRLEKLG